MTNIVPSFYLALISILLVTGCTRSQNQSFRSSSQSLEEIVLENLPLIQDIPPKIGEPTSDRHALAILLRGREASPFLINSLTNALQSRVVDGFQYAVGDLAHRLLCEIYRKPFLWPVANAEPVGGHPQVSFQDYLALVNSPSGREKLRALWVEAAN